MTCCPSEQYSKTQDCKKHGVSASRDDVILKCELLKGSNMFL